MTGHDAREIYVLRLPDAGSVLEWVETLSAPMAGQGIALDPSDDAALWGIVKKSREVIQARRAGQ